LDSQLAIPTTRNINQNKSDGSSLQKCWDHANLADGQVILGQSGYGNRRRKNGTSLILPCVTDLYPELLDDSIPEKDDGPSCSLAEALERQDLFIGQSIATFALQLLWTLFRNGGVDHHGYFINLKAGKVLPMPIDPVAWARFKPKKKRPGNPALRSCFG